MDNDLGLELDILPVGNGSKSGDAILLRYGNLVAGEDKQTVILIDGGFKATADTIIKQLDDYYKCRNFKGKLQIDLMILTHPDADHVGGLLELAKSDDVEIKSIMMHRPWSELTPRWFKDGRITKDSLKRRIGDAFETAYNLDIATEKVKNFSYRPGKYQYNGATIAILGPDSKFYKECIAKCDKTPDSASKSLCSKTFSHAGIEFESYEVGNEIDWDNAETTSDINESSIVFYFEYLGVKILFTGDAGKESLTRCCDKAAELGINLSKLDIIKLPHHGSRKNIDPHLMDKLGGKGTTCYISCVAGDEGHHPSMRLVNMLKQKGFRIVPNSGDILWYHHNAPSRVGYDPVNPLDYYNKMEKL